MKELSRRKFLQVGSVAAAATVLSGCTLNLQRIEYLESYREPPEETLPGEDLWYASTCRQCAAGCGILVRVSNGRARKIEGNPAHPVNRGKLCARGQAALQELYDPDRLRNAVKQTGGRNSLQFEPIEWGSALHELTEVLEGVNPASIAFLGGNPATHLADLIRRFMVGLGAPEPVFYSLADDLDGRAALSRVSQTLYGLPALPHYDIAHSDVLFSFGANFLETWISPVSQSRAYGQMRKQGLGKRGYFVQFEPRMSSTAACADEWVPIRPGTEGLVALGLGKLISEKTGRNGKWYVDVDLAGLADISGVAMDTMERLAGIFARFEHSVAIPGGAPTGHQNGAAALEAIHALNMLVAAPGRSGGLFLSSSEASGAASYAQLEDLAERMREGQVQVLMVHGVDPVFELPGGLYFSEALRSVPLVVSFSSTVNDTAALSDMILPDHTNLEAWGYQIPVLADRPVTSGLQPVMRPLYDTRATGDVILALSKQLLPESAELPWNNEADLLEEYAAAQGTDWAEWRRQGGDWSKEVAWQPPAAVDPELDISLPVFNGDPSEYRYHLHVYPSTLLGDGRGANKPWLQEAPDPMTTVAWQSWIEVHPDTAHDLGVENDDVVQVTSPIGSIEAVVYLSHGIGRDTVAMPIGRGHKQYGRFAKNFGSNPMQLIVSSVDEKTGTLAWGATRVKMEKTGETRTLPRLESVEGVEYLRGGGEEH